MTVCERVGLEVSYFSPEVDPGQVAAPCKGVSWDNCNSLGESNLAEGVTFAESSLAEFAEGRGERYGAQVVASEKGIVSNFGKPGSVFETDGMEIRTVFKLMR